MLPGPMTCDELYCADEVTVTGTAAEVTPVRELDDRRIGQVNQGLLLACCKNATTRP
ncbi:MAG: hypothetical protein R3C68_02030 [Myxococcota bacterium]